MILFYFYFNLYLNLDVSTAYGGLFNGGGWACLDIRSSLAELENISINLRPRDRQFIS